MSHVMSYVMIQQYLCNETPLYDSQFSTIYKGYKISNHSKLLVIKKIKKNLNRRFIKEEIKILKNINHKYVLKVNETLYKKKKLHLVLDYCNGGNILEYILSNDHSYDQIYITQIIEGMKYLYTKNIIHRNIKPENILIHEHTIKICDFGLSKSMFLDTIKNSICGSPKYMAPELFTYKKYSRKSDIWSLGIILYEILYKQKPFKNKNINELEDLKCIRQNINQQSNIFNLIENMLIVDEKLRMNWKDLLEYTLIFDNVQKPICYTSAEPITIKQQNVKSIHSSLNISNISNIPTIPTIPTIPNTFSEFNINKHSIDNTSIYSSSAPSIFKLSESVQENYIDSQLYKNKNKNNIKKNSSLDNLNYHNIIGESPENNTTGLKYYYKKMFKK